MRGQATPGAGQTRELTIPTPTGLPELDAEQGALVEREVVTEIPAPTIAAAIPSEPREDEGIAAIPSGAPASSATIAPIAAASAGPPGTAEAAIRETLDDYAQAYDRLDARAAAIAWPSVDEKALARAFAALRLQNVAFERCQVAIVDALAATASCLGTVQYVRRVGNTAPQLERRAWTFRLKRQGAAWQIESVAGRRGPRGAVASTPAPATAPVSSSGSREDGAVATSGTTMPAASSETVSTGGVGSPSAEDAAIRATLGVYAQAYDRLDARAAASAWPSVDEKALARAFAALRLQNVTFERCQVAIVDALTATASCVGTVQYVRRVGNMAPQLERRAWTFRLKRHDTAWQIASVSGRARP